MVQLRIPLQTLQLVAKHLLYWRKARVADVFQLGTRVAIAQSLDLTTSSPIAVRYARWQAGRRRGVGISFPDIIVAFASGGTLQEGRQKLDKMPQADFDRLLSWLVAEGVLVQVA